MSTSALRAAVARFQRTAAPAGEQLPLAALRSRVDLASAETTWLLHPDGVLGRTLVVAAGGAITYPLTLTGDVVFTGRGMLFPHDWRDLTGALRVSVVAIGPDGVRRELWSDVLAAEERGRPRGREARCTVSAATAALELAAHPVEPTVDGDRQVARAIWVQPTLIDPQAPPPAPRETTTVAPAAPTSEPLISVLTPVHDPPLAMLEEAIASVTTQTFPHWELCLVDDGSINPEITAALQHHASTNPRIHLTRHDTARGIAAATNAALELATGRYIALLDHDDTLEPDALQHIADQITADPNLDMIYTDEDVVADDGSFVRHIKPGWSPEHLAALMYTCHLGVYRRTLAVELGGFSSRFDGCQDYEFVLRLIERTDRVAHVPRILYHWRAHALSTAGSEQAKPYAYLTQPTAIAEHLQRGGIDADVQFAHLWGLHRIVHRVPESTTVDLVLDVQSDAGLGEAAASWATQAHPSWSIVLSAPDAVIESILAALSAEGIPDTRIVVVPGRGLGAAAQAATAEHLLLMQTPAIGLTHDWLTRLLGYSAQPGIAAAGPILLAADGRIEQAGIAIPGGIPLHIGHAAPVVAAPGVVYNLSAVSGILATPRAVYHELGGLNASYRELALIDYCLRAGEQHQRTVIVPDARLRRTGSDPTTNDLATIWRLRERWARSHTHDPYYNPNYRTDRGDYVLKSY
jgi:O-antigen biosynthesis protein